MHKMVNGTKFREIGNDDDDTVLPTIRTAEATFLAAVAAARTHALCACLPHAAPKQTHNAKSGERNKTNKQRKEEEQKKNRFECNF